MFRVAVNGETNGNEWFQLITNPWWGWCLFEKRTETVLKKRIWNRVWIVGNWQPVELSGFK